MEEIDSFFRKMFSENTCQIPTIQSIIGEHIDCYYDPYEYMSFIFGSIEYHYIVFLNMMKLYSEYNYGFINISFTNGIMDRTTHKIYIQNTRNRYIIFSITVSDCWYENNENKCNFHANSLFIDTVEWIAEYYEPHWNNRTNVHSSLVQLEVERYIKKHINGNIYMIPVHKSCPMLGPQAITDDSLCQSWELEFIYFKLYLPHIKINEYYKYLSLMDRDQLKEHIRNFMICIFWKITGHEERYIFLALNLMGCIKYNYTVSFNGNEYHAKSLKNKIHENIDMYLDEFRETYGEDQILIDQAYAWSYEMIKLVKIYIKRIKERYINNSQFYPSVDLNK